MHIMTGPFNHNQSGEYFPFMINTGVFPAFLFWKTRPEKKLACSGTSLAEN